LALDALERKLGHDQVWKEKAANLIEEIDDESVNINNSSFEGDDTCS
jgi:hypothetical protein